MTYDGRHILSAEDLGRLGSVDDSELAGICISIDPKSAAETLRKIRLVATSRAYAAYDRYRGTVKP